MPPLDAASSAWAWQDSFTLGLFFAGMVAVVWWSLMQKEETSSDYLLAGRDAGWIAIGASIFASNIGSEHVVGLAGAGATTGMAMAHWELHAWVLILHTRGLILQREWRTQWVRELLGQSAPAAKA